MPQEGLESDAQSGGEDATRRGPATANPASSAARNAANSTASTPDATASTAPPDVLEAAHEARLLQAGRMLAGIVHEIRNPLAVIQGYAQLLQERVGTTAEASAEQSAEAEDLASILEETHRLSALVDDMLSFVRRDGAEAVGSVDVERLVQATLNLTTHAMRQARVSVVANLPEQSCRVRGQQGAYIQVLMNLLDNARESLEEAGTAQRGISIRVLPGETHCELLVSNNGPPIPPAQARSVFESFFTTKAAGAGTGLGLALCREILGRFGGSITLLEPRSASGDVSEGHEDWPVSFRLLLPNA